MPQRHAGDRKQLPIRVPREQAEAIEARAQSLGMSVTAYMGALVARELGLPSRDLTPPDEQEALFRTDIAQ